ncbi:MAG: hypothetical protein QXX68_00510 [Candidatus Pacearchaeota archaeon]
MGFFKKKEEVPNIEPFQKEEEIIPKLPSLPKSSSEEISQTLIKSNLNLETEPPSLEDKYERFKPNKEESFPGLEAIPSLKENRPIGVIQAVEKNIFPINESKPNPIITGPDSVFVKIEKFRQAKKEAMEIKKELDEITTIIGRINEVEKKEEDEMKDISLSLDAVKKRFNQIESLLFDKI